MRTIWEALPLLLRKILMWVRAIIVTFIGLTYAAPVGRNIIEYNVEYRSPGRSEADARAAQWDWPLILFVIALVVSVIFILLAYFYSTMRENNSLYR